MTSLGEFAYSKLLECDSLKANQIQGNIKINDISVNTLSFNDKWKFSLDTNNDLLLKNEMQNVVSLSGSALTGHISILGGGGGGATNLSDLNDVTAPNPTDITTNGSIMYYNQPTNTYSFTNEFAYALSTWNVRLPFSFTDIDLQILQGANDISKNIRIGGAKRTASTENGRSIAIGEEAGQILQKNNCIAIGYKSGQNLQGNNIFTTGDSIAIGTEAGENNQEDSAISIGKAAGKTNQKSSSIAIGTNAGNTGQNVNSLAIGFNTAKTNQGVNAISIGYNSGLSSQAGYSTFIGTSAGNTGSHSYAVGIGYLTSSINCGTDSIGIGREALFSGGGESSIAIGKEAGKSDLPDNSIAIGTEAGFSNGGQNCIYIGQGASLNGSNHNNVIVLNASSTQNNPAGSDRCYIKPLRAIEGTSLVQYDNTSGEVTYNNTIGGVNITGQITLTGNSGVSGEVLTSQGSSAPIWGSPSVNFAYYEITASQVDMRNGPQIIFGNEVVSNAFITRNAANNEFTFNQVGMYKIESSAWFAGQPGTSLITFAELKSYHRVSGAATGNLKSISLLDPRNNGSENFLQMTLSTSYILNAAIGDSVYMIGQATAPVPIRTVGAAGSSINSSTNLIITKLQ